MYSRKLDASPNNTYSLISLFPVNQSDDQSRSECNVYIPDHNLYDMDDRDSVYLDTISVASGFPNNRKSMSMSRQTIYHSAEDLTQSASVSPRSSATPPSGSGGNGGLVASASDFLARMRSSSHAELERLNGGGDEGPASIHRTVNGKLNNGGTKLKIDEVSERLLFMSNNKTVTYSEWKSRVTFLCFSLSFCTCRCWTLLSHLTSMRF